jgi:uncharacterized glyoxalase superfamily protein PhnB
MGLTMPCLTVLRSQQVGHHAANHAGRRSAVLNLHLVVDDLDVARRALMGNGIDVSDVNDMGGGIRYAYFSDPDGNSWALQQVSS